METHMTSTKWIGLRDFSQIRRVAKQRLLFLPDLGMNWLTSIVQ
jgi:hypothetical protein